MSKKILFYYLKTGAGHYMPAKNIAESLKNISDYEPVLLDGLERSGNLVKRIIENGYSYSINKQKKIFEFTYLINKIPLVRKIVLQILRFVVRKNIYRDLYKYKPDKIVVLHFFLVKPVKRAIEIFDENIKEIVFVTDPFSAHSIWFNEKNVNYIVSSDIVFEYAKAKNIEKLVNLPFPVNSKFSDEISNNEISDLLNTYNLDETKKTILIIGGGEGIPHGKQIIDIICELKLKYNFIMVCGRNNELLHYGEMKKNEYSIKTLRLIGFADNVDKLLKISNLIITKAGASIIFETLHSKTPAIIISYIWEQEKGNMQYIVDKKFGVYQPKISKLKNDIEYVFNNYKKFKERYNNYKIENGTTKIANHIKKL